jgi:hypothetical protein
MCIKCKDVNGNKILLEIINLEEHHRKISFAEEYEKSIKSYEKTLRLFGQQK